MNITNLLFIILIAGIGILLSKIDRLTDLFKLGRHLSMTDTSAKPPVPSVEELRKQGYRVRVIHYRYFGDDLYSNLAIREIILNLYLHEFDPYTELDEQFRRQMGNMIAAKGGRTEVHLLTPTKGRATGVAVCSLKDNFCYKTGTRQALERALELIQGTASSSVPSTDVESDPA